MLTSIELVLSFLGHVRNLRIAIFLQETWPDGSMYVGEPLPWLDGLLKLGGATTDCLRYLEGKKTGNGIFSWPGGRGTQLHLGIVPYSQLSKNVFDAGT